ncbi:uncharacterized protein J4E88_010148 [Alternaria novae-zelandiae]|uniref:uncharacterized protein n=1 Tax=Alternaria novae-zelandiae TaxID=430562 RepID=UPI0020C5030E|nr:uncharacterized protein J4E88_010148 [Alternaria novae-zelandiae]KAI4667747.1 hypothetical protein J4E88_010148 [Alternaria novae-zelandiae]
MKQENATSNLGHQGYMRNRLKHLMKGFKSTARRQISLSNRVPAFLATNETTVKEPERDTGDIMDMSPDRLLMEAINKVTRGYDHGEVYKNMTYGLAGEKRYQFARATSGLYKIESDHQKDYKCGGQLPVCGTPQRDRYEERDPSAHHQDTLQREQPINFDEETKNLDRLCEWLDSVPLDHAALSTDTEEDGENEKPSDLIKRHLNDDINRVTRDYRPGETIAQIKDVMDGGHRYHRARQSEENNRATGNDQAAVNYSVNSNHQGPSDSHCAFQYGHETWVNSSSDQRAAYEHQHHELYYHAR